MKKQGKDRKRVVGREKFHIRPNRKKKCPHPRPCPFAERTDKCWMGVASRGDRKQDPDFSILNCPMVNLPKFEPENEL